MRIYLENTNSIIHSLAMAIKKDPASFENWHSLLVKGTHVVSAEWIATILEALRVMHKNLDCDIIRCDDNDVFIIGKEDELEQLIQLAKEFTLAAFDAHSVAIEATHLNFYSSADQLSQLLASKVSASYVNSSTSSHIKRPDIPLLGDTYNIVKQSQSQRSLPQIMLVEDDPLTRRLVTNCFKEENALITAHNGQEAATNYQLYAPDVVFLDIGLPDESGLNILQQLLTIDADAYVVMFSTNSYLENITTALNHGACGFVAKPFRKEKMQHYIDAIAAHRSARAAANNNASIVAS